MIGFACVIVIYCIMKIRKYYLKYEWREGKFHVKQSYRDRQARKLEQLQELQRQAQLMRA